MTPDHPAPHDSPAANQIVRHGFGLKSEITNELELDYHSPIIDRMRAEGDILAIGGLRLRLARAIGFCYGVDKAIDFAYETRLKFPDRRIFLTNEIIHNPQVNRRLLGMGVQFLSGPLADGTTLDRIRAEDVVILPAFGVHTDLLARLRAIGCVLVDTTCGSVVHVWKRVERYVKDGYTALLHGKWAHEETVATCSHVTSAGGHYLIVRDEHEAAMVCDFIKGAGDARTGDAQALAGRLAKAVSPGFDFDRHLARVGIANQTTMLSSESLAIAEMVRQAMIARWGEGAIEDHFRSFETICHATQERQDAVLEMMAEPPDLMLVVGGYNSSNTAHLCEIAAGHCATYHVDDVACLISPERIRHRLSHSGGRVVETEGWLPARRPLTVGVTAGASTPNRVVGEVIERLVEWER